MSLLTANPSNLNDAWVALRHGGNLLFPAALDVLPDTAKTPWGLADRLRSALVALDPERPAYIALSNLLDTVLEGACGFGDTWEKGKALGAAAAEKLLDGTVLKPRRRWTGLAEEGLVVFTTNVTRLGIGKGRRPVAHVVEYLRRRNISLGLITNGTQWRLVWADTDSLAWVEWEADRWLEADQVSGELAVLRRVLSPAALSRGEAELSPLLAAIRDTRRGQAKLSKELGERVRRAVETLLRSREPLIGPTWDEHKNADLYVAACHFVMRLVVTLFAEARELLPIDNPVYHKAYGLRGLLDQLDRMTPERRKTRHMAWPRLLSLFRLLHQGSPHPAMTLPAYGGDLFRPGDAEGDGVQSALALLEALPEPPDDELIHRLIVMLTRTTQRVREGAGWRKVAAPVDFTELTSEYIGILYEGLLDYELKRAGTHPVLFLNLGDQPALPLDRLEAMDDKVLVALVEKAKVKKKAAGKDEEDETEDDEEEEASDDEDGNVDAEADDGFTGEEDDDTSDDARSEARTRALAWGRRAAEVAKFIKKPKGRNAGVIAAYEAQLDTAARQLVADIKLPGEMYLVRWGGTRKGAGTFYTRPQLTLPTVRRTLEPLIYENDFIRSPEQLLALKVCDPAMGSGSFLVAALRVLTAAVIEALHTHDRITCANGRTNVDCELLLEVHRSLPTEGFDERIEALVRRAVVDYCLYGVDKDPLAVELARVALWVETLDKHLPFSFLDHKLRCGDSLVGTWLDLFRDYPLLVFDRQSPDLKYKGVNHAPNVWHQALKDKRAEAISEQLNLLTGQLRLQAVAVNDEELKAAIERVRRLYRDLRAVPIGRPDERARIWRERIQTDAALARVRDAFDTWCALWFWPLDQLEALPMPSELTAPSEAARDVVKALREQRSFFHWELEFPDVFTKEGAGFDAVVGNPPWEIQKPNSKEFFSNHDPLYRAYGKQEALREQKALFEAHPNIEADWLTYNGDFKDRGNFVKNTAEPFGDAKVADHSGGDVSLKRGKEGAALHRAWRSKRARYRGTSDSAHPFRHQGSADLNTYKMFVELAHALLRPGGQLGLLVPSGLYTDKGSGNLRRLLLEHCGWRWLYGFENRNRLFDIHRSFKFCVIIAEKSGQTSSIQAAFMHHDLEDWADAKATLDYPKELVMLLSPDLLSLLEIDSQRLLDLITKVHHSNPRLFSSRHDHLQLEYGREFHMTDDSHLFPPLQHWQNLEYSLVADGEYWKSPVGDIAYPLYEGRMIDLFDHSSRRWVSGKGREARWDPVPIHDKKLGPQYLMAASDMANSQKAKPVYKLGIVKVSSASNTRSLKSALIPAMPCGESVYTLRVQPGEYWRLLLLEAFLCSYAFDAFLRIRFGGVNISAYLLGSCPIPAIEGLRTPICDRICRFASRLSLTGTCFANLSLVLRREIGEPNVAPPRSLKTAFTPHERLRLRCLLDAIVAVLYGLDRGDFAWILKDCDHPVVKLTEKAFCRQLNPKDFWRVDKTQEPELRHTVLSLAAFDDLQSTIATAGGDLETGIQLFCDQNEGEGWMLPESLCLKDLGLTRTANIGYYDDRDRTPQPVRSRMGERFLDWQLTKTMEESWAECERHAKAILEGVQRQPHEEQATENKSLVTNSVKGAIQMDLFGGPVPTQK
jgi:hypothetical protein